MLCFLPVIPGRKARIGKTANHPDPGSSPADYYRDYHPGGMRFIPSGSYASISMKEEFMKKIKKKKLEYLPVELRKDCGMEPRFEYHHPGSMDLIFFNGSRIGLGFSSHSNRKEKRRVS